MGPHTRWRTARVLLLAAVLALAGVLAAMISRPVTHPHRLAWWWLALLFAVAEASVVKVHIRRESVSVSLAEIPLVIGLFLATPAELLTARPVGSAVVFLLVHRQTPVKAAFNTALVVGASAVALAVFSLRVGTGPPVDPRSWAIAVAAAAAAGVLEALCLSWVMSWYGEPITVAVVGREVGTSILVPGLVAVVGVVVVLAADAGGFGLPLAITGGLALFGYRAYAGLAFRYARLERLHQLSGRLATAVTTPAVTAGVLEETTELLRAGYAELVLPGRVSPQGSGPAGWVRWSLRGAGRPHGPRPFLGVLPPASSVRLDRSTGTGRAVLEERGLDEALVTVLQIDDQVRGFLLVGDRTGEERGFLDGDLRLLETVANQSAVALRGAGLVDRLHHEARHDELTGLPNRLAFRERLDGATERDASGVAVMLLDVDGFKAVNDTLGHHAGDELLQELARRFDIAAAGDALVARLGGDEFAMLSGPGREGIGSGEGAGGSGEGAGGSGEGAGGSGEGAGGSGEGAGAEAPGDGDTSRVLTTAQALADRLLACFDEPVTVAGNRVRLGGSVGVAIGPEHGNDASDLLRHADIAMYAAKSAGGGVRLYGRELLDAGGSSVTLAGDLRDAIASRQIGLEVLPVVELVTGAVDSVDVLARWRHPDLGDVAPGVLFATAEHSGQSADLSALVLDQALRLCHSWLERGHRIGIGVNVVPRRLADPAFAERVAESLARSAVPSELLHLEITEAGVVAEPSRALETLGRLRAGGVRLSVDDFGTGFSSLTYLSRLPVHQLKIHRSFVSRIGDSPSDRAVVHSVLDLGRRLGLEVIADGVADTETRNALLDLGCRFGQGPLFGVPAPPEQFIADLEWAMGPAPLSPAPPFRS